MIVWPQNHIRCISCFGTSRHIRGSESHSCRALPVEQHFCPIPFSHDNLSVRSTLSTRRAIFKHIVALQIGQSASGYMEMDVCLLAGEQVRAAWADHWVCLSQDDAAQLMQPLCPTWPAPCRLQLPSLGL